VRALLPMLILSETLILGVICSVVSLVIGADPIVAPLFAVLPTRSAIRQESFPGVHVSLGEACSGSCVRP
jgi:hypothetical protein